MRRIEERWIIMKAYCTQWFKWLLRTLFYFLFCQKVIISLDFFFHSCLQDNAFTFQVMNTKFRLFSLCAWTCVYVCFCVCIYVYMRERKTETSKNTERKSLPALLLNFSQYSCWKNSPRFSCVRKGIHSTI